MLYKQQPLSRKARYVREDCHEVTPFVQSQLFKASFHGRKRPTPAPHPNPKIHTRAVRLFVVLEGCDPEVELEYAEVIAMKSGVG